ncbi:MAG: flagellar hook-length control protein FliK [SAR324 cluster bacterium]|nr:flagellar hook-length control protein FliK [SAR324 cluster bacterium]
MMEAIGQKAVIPVSDEAIVSSELGTVSGEGGEEKNFDATLENMLVELPLEENMLDELLEEDGLSASLSSTLLSQNELDPEIVDANFGFANNSTMPLEMLEDNLWSEDLSSLQTQVLQKTTPISSEMIEVLDPRFAINTSDFDILPDKGIAETGLQSLLNTTDSEFSGPLLQTVFHQVNSLQDGVELLLDEQQAILQKNVSQSIHLGPANLEADAEFSTSDLQTILQKTANQSVQLEGDLEISKSELQPELQPYSNKSVQVQDKNLVQELSSTLENQEENLQEVLKTVFRKGSQVEVQEFEKPVEENLVKLKRAEVPLTPEKIKAAESLQVVEKFKATEGLQATENIKVAEALQVVAKEKTIEGLQTTEKFKVAENFQGGARTKVVAGFQATEKFKVAEEFQSGAKSKVAEGFQMTGMENTGEITEKASVQPSNQFRTLTPQETQLSSIAKSTVDFASAQGINAVSELTGTSIFKAGETTNTLETFRAADLPFNMAQVVNRVRILRGNGVEEMTLRLHPEELGQITLKIRQSGGDLSIDMRVDNPHAKQMVESGFDALRSRFLDQEFSYQDLALNVDINERDSQFGGDRNKSEFEENMTSAERGKKEEIATVEEKPRVGHRNGSGLNLYV